MKFFLILISLLYSLEAKSLFTNNEQKDRSKYIGALKNLVIATQKTRGLTNSFLNGNTVAQLLVYSNRQDMKAAIGDMETLQFSADPVINKRATFISQELISLNSKALKKNSSKVFDEYTELIAQTMMLAQSVAKRGVDKLNPIGRELTSIMMETMLPLTEYVGQLRGLGSGIAAKGSISKGEKDKLVAILLQMKPLSEKFESQMSHVVSKYNKEFGNESIESDVAKTMTLIKEYMSYSKTNFIESKQEVDPDNYFDSGTQIITSIVKIYDVNNKVIESDSQGWF